MNLLVFAGRSQFTAVGLMAAGPAAWTLVPMTLLINLRHLLYGVAVTTELRGARRALAAHMLTDEVFGMHVARSHGRPAFLIGAGLSLFVAWNAGTLVGEVCASLPPGKSLPANEALPSGKGEAS